MANVNRLYKDRLFRLVFGDKLSLLELYNALNNSHYENPDELEITTLEDAVYMSVKNDLSFLIGGVLNLYEHQSTYNPNMPARGLFYLVDVYRKYVETRELNLYGSRLVKLPAPNYMVFYNGLIHQPDRVVLKLSDAFVRSAAGDPCLEFNAVMLNINLGHNKELMERCRKLREYAQFVDRVRREAACGGDLNTAVDRAVAGCIEEGILADFLSGHRAEVLNMFLYDFDEEKYMEMERSEARAMATADALLLFLSGLGTVPTGIKDKIKDEIHPDVQTGWLKLAYSSDSVDDFIQKSGLTP